jgi:ATP-dependent protease Clp ATPase subunit
MTCSFCGKDKEEWNFLIQGSAAAICDVCVATCVMVLGKAAKEQLTAANRWKREAALLIYQHETGVIDGDWGDG